MHIPSAPTDTLSLLSFDEALSRSGRTGGYDPARWLYVPDFYTEYRYLLGTRGEHPLLCIGVNPSTAAPDALDNTLRSVFPQNLQRQVIGDFNPWKSGELSNLIYVYYDRPNPRQIYTINKNASYLDN